MYFRGKKTVHTSQMVKVLGTQGIASEVCDFTTLHLTSHVNKKEKQIL